MTDPFGNDQSVFDRDGSDIETVGHTPGSGANR